MKIVDKLLNRVTMYRLVLYYLIALIGIAVALSFAHVLAYDPYAMLFSTASSWPPAWPPTGPFRASTACRPTSNPAPSPALSSRLIISPIGRFGDLWLPFWAAVLAMASKYIINIRGEHIFNPAAVAVALTYLAINQAASWWIGNATMLPFVLVGGLLVTRRSGASGSSGASWPQRWWSPA